jgi:hypothetical protein
VGLGLVARRQHHPGTHDHGAAEEAGIVSLLNRCIEGIQVGMENRGLRGHEHMFASTLDGNSLAPRPGGSVRIAA